jgi:hypothetical protein
VSDDDRVRVEVGFEGGQVVGGFVDHKSADALQSALHEDGPRVIVLEMEDGPYHVSSEGLVLPALQPVEPRRLRHGLVHGWAGDADVVSSDATEQPARRESTEHVRALVDSAQKGDRAALEELYLIHFDRIYSYLHMTSGTGTTPRT